MKQIHINNPWHADVLCRRMADQRVFRPGYEHVISVSEDDKLLGGVLYDHYYERSIEMHVEALVTDWGNRRVIRTCFGYPFDFLGVEVIFGRVPSTNEHALDFDKRLGFVEHTRLKEAVPGGDLVILSMKRHQCRWLPTRGT